MCFEAVWWLLLFVVKEAVYIDAMIANDMHSILWEMGFVRY